MVPQTGDNVHYCNRNNHNHVGYQLSVVHFATPGRVNKISLIFTTLQSSVIILFRQMRKLELWELKYVTWIHSSFSSEPRCRPPWSACPSSHCTSGGQAGIREAPGLVWGLRRVGEDWSGLFLAPPGFHLSNAAQGACTMRRGRRWELEVRMALFTFSMWA